MEADARKLGAKVQSAVSGKTDYLVCGKKTGPAKMNKANALGVQVITEAQYLDMLKNTEAVPEQIKLI